MSSPYSNVTIPKIYNNFFVHDRIGKEFCQKSMRKQPKNGINLDFLDVRNIGLKQNIYYTLLM